MIILGMVLPLLKNPFGIQILQNLSFKKQNIIWLYTKHSSESYHITAKSGVSVGTVVFLILRVIRFASNCENMKTQTRNFLSWFHKLDYISAWKIIAGFKICKICFSCFYAEINSLHLNRNLRYTYYIRKNLI